jgi:hypothetical protein
MSLLERLAGLRHRTFSNYKMTKNLLMGVLVAAMLIGCNNNENDYKKLGFASQQEMNQAFSLGYHTKEKMLAAQNISETTVANSGTQASSIDPTCKGNPESEKCNALAEKIASETPEQSAARRQSLEAERERNMRAVSEQTAGISAAIGLHISEIKKMIDLNPRSCNRYTAGPGVGCMTRANSQGAMPINLGDSSPCRSGGTVQLDFSDDFYLIAVTCGSNRELLEKFSTSMKKTYGAGRTKADEQGDFSQTDWSVESLSVRASMSKIGDAVVYSATVLNARGDSR